MSNVKHAAACMIALFRSPDKKPEENDMASIGYYNGIALIDTSNIASTNVDFYMERIVAEAQDLADECECEIDAWQRDDAGERTSHTGITVQPQPK
jgi:hypothetical protein